MKEADKLSGRNRSPRAGASAGAGTGASEALPVVALSFAVLLVLPALALGKLCGLYGAGVVLGVAFAVSLVAFVVSAVDKRRARNGQWRVSEATLHLLELAGGWPGSFLAQRLLRHKVSKVSYQFVFWLIVLLYQYLSFDYVCGWAWSRELWHAFAAMMR